MRFKKSSAEIVARFAGALPRSSLIEQKKMFGYPSAFVHGNYFAGLYEENVVLRLPEPLRDKLPTLAPATVFDWLVIPAKMASSPQWLAALLESALPLVASLPPKMKKPARRAKPRVVR
jgi:TfoX/Sxy family transcriptional regulator of competence genes